MSDRVVKVTVAAQVNGFVHGMEQAEKSARKAKAGAEDATAAYERQVQAMNQVGLHLTAIGVVATAATALAVKAAIDWESAWTGVTKTVDGTASEMAALEEDLRGLTKVLPATHEEIAAVAEAAGQLGVQRENVAAFTKTMVDLAETTNLTAEEAATSIAQLMNVMQTAPEDVDNLGAAVVALGNDGASTERDIVQMAQRIAGSGKIIGLTEGQVLGFANALASVGIEAEAGGSAISRIMTDIAMSVSAGGEELETFAEVAGMSSMEFQKAFKDDPADAIATFIEGLARIDAEGGDVFATLSKLGQTDVRVSRALLGMANSGDLLRESLQLGNAAWDENTALLEEAEKRYATTEAKIQMTANAVRDAAIDFGDVFLPAVSATADAVGALANAFTDLPVGVQTVVAAGTALAGAAALAGGAFLLAVPKIAAFQLALTTLAASQMPAVAAAAAGTTAVIGKMTTGMGAAARFLTGPWGIAFVAAAVGVVALQKVVDNLATSAEEFQNIIKTGPTAARLLEAGDRSLISALGDATGSVEDFKRSLDLLGEGKDFLRGFDLPAQQLKSSLGEISKQLATTAASDLPAAQRAFRELVETYQLNDEEQRLLLVTMDEYRLALTDVASEQGLFVSSGDEAADVTALLNIAMTEAEPPATSAADAYRAAADEANALADEVLALIDAVNEANGIGQDAVSTNARYQASLAGIADEVKRQKDEYKEAHGSTKDFKLSLDESTKAGSANAAMLADVAADAQTAARAQYELDMKTMSAKEAAERYATTLAAQRQAFEDSAVAAGFNKDEVHKLGEKIFGLPSEKEIELLIETAEAEEVVDSFIRTYDGKEIRMKLTTNQVAVNGRVYGGLRDGHAAGGLIRGPGTGTSDSIPAMVSNGEWIVRAAPASIPANRAALEYINRGGVIQGFARGGEVQPRYAQSPWMPVTTGGGRTPTEVNVTNEIYPAPGMSEETVGRIAAEKISFAMRTA